MYPKLKNELEVVANYACNSVHPQICGVICMPVFRHLVWKENFNSVFQFVSEFYL
jgi:hypothetical protein